MLGDTPEERLRSEKRRKTMMRVAAVAVIVVLVAVGISLLPPTASKNIYLVPVGSHCGGEGGTASEGSMSCTLILAAKTGTITPAMVKSVLINGTNTTPVVKQSGAQVVVSAGITLVSYQRGLPDVGPSVVPPTVGSVVVYLSDGTTVSALLGAGGIVTAGSPTRGQA